MKDNYSHITIVLDRSGSMGSVLDATIEGMNTFISQQKSVKNQEATVTLIQFDDRYENKYSFRPLKEVDLLNKDTYIPRGGTALRDAIGKAILETGAALKALPESLRPSKVLFVIQTDGFENASREYSLDMIFEMINHQKDKYLWDFIFLGAGQDAIATASTYGINAKSSLSYTANNTAKVFAAASSYVNTARLCRSAADVSSVSFSEAERDEAIAPDNGTTNASK